MIQEPSQPSSRSSLLHLFNPGFEQNGVFTALTPERSLWMLAYLAVQDRWVGRDELIRLLWPDADPETAKNNLRQLLHRTRKLGLAPTLEIERTQLRWREGSDLHLFRQAYQARNWQEVVETYQGELLSGFDALEAEEFSAWLEIERRDLNALWREAAQNLAEIFEQQARFEEAGNLLERILRTDPLAEDVLCAYLRIASKSGRQDRALELYREFAKQLDDELGLEPRAETQKLMEELRSRQPQAPTPTLQTGPMARLPLPTAPFVGRRSELEWLEDKLNLPGVQVLCLVGPGGIGKTHLALEAARRFAGQAVFVSLVGHGAGQSLAPAVAESLGMVLAGKGQAESELADLIKDLAVLIVLDNVEQVIEEARLLALRLEGLGRVRLLFTSRVRLGIASEHALELSGLGFPAQGEPLSAAESYDSVRLLLETIWRTVPELKLSQAEQADMVRICQSVAGVPLALVLAGSWARMLSLAEIAAELGRDLDFLGGAVKGLPSRHQGMREVFEYSWKLLSGAQQQVLAALSVFRGGFDRTAAAAITGASNVVLLELLDSSLIRRIQGANRFDLHELVRQYAQEKLGADPQQAVAVRQKQAQWFLTWAEQINLRKQKGPEMARWMHRIEQEHDNLRAVLAWAEDAAQAEVGIRLGGAIALFWLLRGYASEGRGWLSRALDQLGDLQGSALGASALVDIGELQMYQGNLGAADQTFQQALRVSRAAEAPDQTIAALNGLGTVAYHRAQYPQARQRYSELLELARPLGDAIRVSTALGNMAWAFEREGNYLAALEVSQESLALRIEIGDSYGQTFSLMHLAENARNRGDNTAAQTYLEQSLEISTALEDRQMMFSALRGLGNLAFQRGDQRSAQSLYRQALQISHNLKYQLYLADLLESIAALLAATPEGKVAGWLLGCAEALRESTQNPIRANDLGAYLAQVESLKTMLGEMVFSQAWQMGRGMNLEQALELGLEALDAANL